MSCTASCSSIFEATGNQAFGTSAEDADRRDDSDPSDRTASASRAAGQGAVRCGAGTRAGPRGDHGWKIPVDPDLAILLTSDLVTNAIMHGDGAAVTLAIRCSRGHLRVDVYDSPRSLPVTGDQPVDVEIGRGLILVATLSDEWGSFRTPAGKAVYFTLAFQPDLPWDGDRAASGIVRGDGAP